MLYNAKQSYTPPLEPYEFNPRSLLIDTETAVEGQMHWSVHGPETKAFIGRAEQADLGRGLSSSYACYNCCPDSFFDGWL